MFFPISNIPLRKHHSGSRLTEFCKLARANCNLHSCSNFALVLHEIAFLFSQSLEVELLNSLPILFPWSYFLTHFVTSTCVCFFFSRTWLTWQAQKERRKLELLVSSYLSLSLMLSLLSNDLSDFCLQLNFIHQFIYLVMWFQVCLNFKAMLFEFLRSKIERRRAHKQESSGPGLCYSQAKWRRKVRIFHSAS